MPLEHSLHAMRRFEAEAADATYVSLPHGLFTASGVWFRATEEMVQAYAAPVLRHAPLPALLTRAEVWLRSPQTLTLWLLPLFLTVIPPLAAAGAALVLYAGWASLSPSLTSLAAVRVFRLLERVWLQAFYYVFVLSALAGAGQYAALGTGLAGFILLRWGLVRLACAPLVRRISGSLHALPIPDQVLRGFILRVAVKYHVSLPQLDRIEQDVLKHTARPS